MTPTTSPVDGMPTANPPADNSTMDEMPDDDDPGSGVALAFVGRYYFAFLISSFIFLMSQFSS